MKQPLAPDLLPLQAVLITCSSHEERCLGAFKHMGTWKPLDAALFHYDDENARRELHHHQMEEQLASIFVKPTVLQFTETDAARSLHENMRPLREIIGLGVERQVVLDISVFTKRHLLMMLRWLDDEGLWDRLTVIYTEPEDYDVSQYLPLSFGLASFRQIPGFPACADLSRPIHLVLFLGYEGDRALAVYEKVEPVRTTVIIPHPPYNPSWVGRTEKFNADLLEQVGESRREKVDPVDPDDTNAALVRIYGDVHSRDKSARIVCPLGTKPQVVGLYSYIRECTDPPAIVYASPLRHNHEFYSHGVARTWVLKQADRT
jgi:hypothetical protein